MAWRTAKSILQLFEQVNELAPNRSKVSDGTIGDADHQNRTSDHNPWVKDGSIGVVTAGDYTDDDSVGVDMRVISEAIRKSQDARVKYVISEGRMYSSYPTSHYPPWTWRPYGGPNGHFRHMHVSVQPTKALYDNTSEWEMGDVMALTAKEEENVKKWNKQLEELGSNGGYVQYVIPDVRKNIVTMDELEAAVAAIQSGNVDAYARDLAQRNAEKLAAIKDAI